MWCLARVSPVLALASASLVGALFPTASAAQAGSVRSELEINESQGGFGGTLASGDRFGNALAALGDLDGDGVGDLAVGADGTNDGGQDVGVVWILFLNADGTVKAEQKIGELAGGFGGALDPDDHFGCALAALGDLDGDGAPELAVGAEWDDDGFSLAGAVWILSLHTDGTVKAHQKISHTEGGLAGSLAFNDNFGGGLAALGDLDGDGRTDLAVGAPQDGPGDTRVGAVWILFLNADGTVKAEQKINEQVGGFDGNLDNAVRFGDDLAGLGDLDGDGTLDLAVGAPTDDEGALWILFLNSDGTVRDEQKIARATGGFGGTLGFSDGFGISVAAAGDLDGDGTTDLAVGAHHDSVEGFDQGALWILFLNADGTVESELKIGENSGGFGGTLEPGVPFSIVGDQFGWSVAPLGDLDGDGNADLAVGAPFDVDAGVRQGAVWILFLRGAPACFTLDFETEDDLATPLANGQHVDTEFGILATFASSGPNAGIAVFDSTPGGPNDPSQDPDLLVGTGNLLVLQTENLPPDANDVFPRPNDDEDGGTISISFPSPVEARGVSLVDLDAGDGATQIVLTDAAARARTYTVPANWTGDLLLAQPGRGTLDLTTLAPQPGFGSVASAAEDAGFDAQDVVRMDVVLDGSGGLDDLALCVTSPLRASASVRAGSGVNAATLSSLSRPVLGGTWRSAIECPGMAGGTALLEVRRSAAATTTPVGEVLIGGPLVHRSLGVLALAREELRWDVPGDLALLGLEVHAQGLCRSAAAAGPRTKGVRRLLTNAVDLVLGL